MPCRSAARTPRRARTALVFPAVGRPLPLAALLSALPVWAAAQAVTAPSPAGDPPATTPPAASAVPAEPAAPAPRPAAPAAAAMPAVIVTGSGERDRGYRAKRSRSATGLDLDLRETPQSVSVITRTQLDDFGLSSVNGALQLAPGVTVERVETDRTYYTARGFDITNFQLDGIGMPFSNGAQWGDIDLAVYERVEVLRGANGLLSSTGFPSATVNFVRKQPTADLQGSAALTLGSWQRRRLEGDVSGGLNSENSVRGRLVAAVQEGGDIGYLDRWDRHQATLYGVIDVDLAPGTVLSLAHLTQRTKTDSPLWGALPATYSDGTPTDYDRATSTAPDWAWWTNRDERTTVELSHELTPDWQWRSVLTRRRATSDSELLYLYGLPDRETGAGLLAYPSAFRGRYTQTILNSQAQGPFTLAGRRHEAMLGVALAREQAWERSDYPASTTDPIGVPLERWPGDFPKPAFDASSDGSDWTTKRLSAFAALRWSLRDDLKLIAGANLTRISSTGENYGTSHTYSATKTSPYLGLVYDLTPELALYASHTRIFSPQAEPDASGAPLPPVVGASSELGAKQSWLGDQLVTTIAWFDTRQDGLATFDHYEPNFVAVYRPENVRSRGLELEATGRLGARWNLNAGFSHFRMTRDDGTAARRFVPRSSARVSLSWQPVEPLTLSVATRWQSAIQADTTGARQSSYALVDASLGYRVNARWTAAVHLENLTDRKVWNSLYWDQAFYNAPFNARVSLSYRH